MANRRDERMKEITDRLQAGLEELFSSEKYTEYLRVMSQFHHYSFNNTLLIALQRPDATLVAGYRAWETKFNRHVMKGEKGIQIIAPAPIREKQEKERKKSRSQFRGSEYLRFLICRRQTATRFRSWVWKN